MGLASLLPLSLAALRWRGHLFILLQRFFRVNLRKFLVAIMTGLAAGLNAPDPLLPAARAQAPAPAPAPAKPPAKNYISNGGFESVITFKNLYDGVDARGDIRVQQGDSPVYLEGGNLTDIPFACSPNFVDVNKDGLPDLIVVSPDGHLYWLPNVGKKGEPKFEHAKLVETYLGPAARIYVCDWNGDGREDLLFGNINGEVNILPNLPGGGNEPRWTQSMGKPRWFHPSWSRHADKDFEADCARIGRDPITIGVYSAPCFADWNKDGIPDLILGEGTYSANSVYVWINSGTKANPAFKTECKFPIAFGEGREQLTPSAYDWNGDGILDLIVGDRDGRLALYLGTAEAIKDSKDIKPLEVRKNEDGTTKFIAIGGREKVGSLISPYVCDYNEDGIPDILYGTTSGAVNVALGKGDRKAPELDASMPLKGVDFAKDFKTASGWSLDTFSGLPEVVSKEENPNVEIKEGKRAFYISFFEKFWYWTYIHWPTPSQYSSYRGLQWQYVWPPVPNPPTGYREGCFYLWNSISPFIQGKDYEISFLSKGKGMRLYYSIAYYEDLPEGPKGEPLRHTSAYGDELSLDSSWRQTRKIYRLLGIKWKRHDTNGQTNSNGRLYFLFIGKGDAWLDDVKIMEVEKK